MNDINLDAIRARAEAATEGPWTGVFEEGDMQIWSPGEQALLAVAGEHVDAEFIAHAREDVPWLLAEVDRLRLSLRKIREDQERAWTEVDRLRRGRDIWRADRDRLAATVDRVREALTDHPHCDRRTGDDPITCGWKRAVLDVQAAIERTDS